MRTKCSAEEGNVLICALCTILIISLIGANVLRNCTTRFNVSSSQVRSWKESLFAAEAGGDIAYAEVRKTVLDSAHAFSGWDNAGVKHVSPITTFGGNNLVTSTVVDLFYNDPAGNAWYRSRSKGTAPVMGLARTGMDDRMGAGVRGDSLLRKIDFKVDHFLATYGPNGDGVGTTLTPVPNPQITRRIEQINAPITPFEAAIKAAGTFEEHSHGPPVCRLAKRNCGDQCRHCDDPREHLRQSLHERRRCHEEDRQRIRSHRQQCPLLPE
jgi:hypothetical protein